ncbi:MAG: DUF4870 domain-containing protein [Peptostreptococcaceae bacterium]
MDNYGRSISRENIIMLVMAASIILFNIVGFIVCYFVWCEFRQESDFINANGRKLLNFHISFVIYEIIAGLLIIAIIGAFLIPVVSVAYFVLTIIGMIKYGTHKDYDYPFTINFIK